MPPPSESANRGPSHFADSEELVRNSGVTLIEVGKDHRLADPESLEMMLKACEGKDK